MRRRILVGGLLVLMGMVVYVPWVKAERIYDVVPVQQAGSAIVSMGRTDRVREERQESAGYDWLWSTHATEPAWFGTERTFRIDTRRLLLQIALLTLLIIAAQFWLRNAKPIEPDRSTTGNAPSH